MISAVNYQFERFVEFAQERVKAGKDTAIARTENLGTDPATVQAICIIFACYSRIMQHFKMDTLGTDLVSGQGSGSSETPKLPGAKATT